MTVKRWIGQVSWLSGLGLALLLPGCVDGSGTCPTDPAVNWRIHYPYPSSSLVDATARPAVQGLINVGSTHSLVVETVDGEFCGISPSVTWHLTNPALVRITGGSDALLTAIAPGHTEISATVRYGGRVSEATLFWCQPPASDGPPSPFPSSQCTWIPMDGVRIVP